MGGTMKHEKSTWLELWQSGLLGRFILICLGVWLHAADTLVTATILPKVVSDIGGIDYMSWNLAIYECGSIFSGAACAMLCGRRGIRQIMLSGATLYGSGCIVAACAGTMPWLLAGRLAQGVGGGLLVTLSYVAIERSFPQHLWTKLFGIVSVIWGVGSLLGPLIGGVLADAGLWRMAFVSFAVQAAILGLATARWLPIDGQHDGQISRLPLVTLLLLAFATAAIAEASIVPGIVLPMTLCGGGLLLLYLAALADKSSVSPLLPRDLLAVRRPLGAGLFMVFALSAGTTGFATYGPLLLTIILRKSSLFSGYVLAVEAVSWSLATLTIAFLPALSPRSLIRLGSLCVVGGIGGLSLGIPTGFLPGIIASAIAQGAGFGLCFPAIVERVIRLAGAHGSTLAAGAPSTVQRIGYAVGAAITGVAAHAAGLSANITLTVAQCVGFWVFACFAPLLLIGIVCAWRFSAGTAILPAAHKIAS
jgi:MFS family permease